MAGRAMLNQLYDASYGRLVVQLFAFCGDLDLAEEAVQEAFVTAVRRHREVSEVHDQESWVRTVALERLRTWRRHEGSVRRSRIAVPGSEAAIELDEDQAEVIAALAALDDEQREVVVLEQLADLALAPSGGWSYGVVDLDRLRDLGAQVQPPAFGTLAGIARRRRTRIYAGELGAVLLCLLLAAVVGLVAGSDDDDDQSLPRLPGRDSWTPERIRDHPKAYGTEPTFADVGDRDVAARVWMVCTVRCESWNRAVSKGRVEVPSIPQKHRLRWTMEVTRDGFETSALVPEFGQPGRVSFLRDDLFLVSQPEAGAGCCEETRHVVSADGDVVDLTLVEPAKPRPQPGMTLVDGRLAVIDLDAGTFAEVAVPFVADAVQWAPNPSTWLWGISADSNVAGDVQTSDAVWQEPQGYFRRHRLAAGPVTVEVEPVDEVGKMAFTEENWDTGGLALHLSENRGRTWQRIEVSSRLEIRRLLE
ncbi:MAG: RNA polymerase sigma factor [Nocardioides sp.]